MNMKKSYSRIEVFHILVQYICMKHWFFTFFLVFMPALLALLTGCKDVQQIHSSYKPVLPVLPDDWIEILGEAHWRMEWIGEEGAWHEWEGNHDADPPSLDLIQNWTTPVLAWPFWPELGLSPGVMRPSGALFPWDTYGKELVLGWKGGVDAVFWKELAAVGIQETSQNERLPWLFDWPRFREMMAEGDIGDAVKRDPWLVDWKEVGRKTVESGFDRRRIKAMKSTEVEVNLPEGRWLSSSPFAPVLEASGEKPLVLEVTDSVGVWVSSEGILKVSTSGWIFRAW